MAAEDIEETIEREEDLEVDLDEESIEELDEELTSDDDDDDVSDIEIPSGDTRQVVEEDDEDIPDADDVEASLDAILKEKLVVDDDVEDDGTPEVDDRSDGTESVLPKQSDEFVCTSCFLVKSSNQLADKKKRLCRDCV